MNNFFLKLKRQKIKNNSGYAALVSVLFFVFISLAVILGLVSPSIQTFKNSRNLINSRSSLFLAYSGAEDYYYRLRSSIPTTSNCSFSGQGEIGCNSFTLNQNEVKSLISQSGETLTINTNAKVAFANKDVRLVLSGGVISGIVFEKGGFSVGSGGVFVQAGSSTTDLYSNGPVLGQGIGSTYLSGNIYSAGPSGLIENVRINNGYANTIKDSSSALGLYYQTIINSVSERGLYYPGSPNPALHNFPINDSIITALKNDTLSGGIEGVSPCNLTLNGGSIGPKKYNCNLTLNPGFYTMLGPVWVSGNLTISAGVNFTNAFSGKQIPFIVDNELNRTTSSKIFWNTAEQFGWNYDGPLFISMNESAFLGGSEKAITVTANSPMSGQPIYRYAPKGLISFENGVNAHGVLTASYKVNVQDGSSVSFGGINSPIQLNIPSVSYGSWGISSWIEVQ